MRLAAGYSAPPDPLAVIKGREAERVGNREGKGKGRERNGTERNGTEGKGSEGKGREGK